MAIVALTSAALGLAVSFILYQIAIIIQRIYFSPLSAFPGPRLAAATYLPELYYDVFKGEGGQLPFAHRKWHEQYGPIIRINPDELHVLDSSWYETLYAPSRPVRKLPDFGHRFKATYAAAGTEDPALYRLRRNALNPFFAKRRIADFGPEIQQICNRVIARFETEYRSTGRVLNLHHAWECLTTAIGNSITFGRGSDLVETPDFTSQSNRATEALAESSKLFYHFPLLPTMVNLLPEYIVTTLMPPVKLFLDSRKEIELAVSKAQTAHANGKNDDRTLVGSLLQQALPPEELALPRLTEETITIVNAGGETVARTLALADLHIISQPSVRDRLVEELVTAIPDPTQMPDWKTLSNLPYLSACVEEAIRLSYGVTEKRSRAYDGGDLMYKEWRIPAGTFVSMNNYDVSHDEAIFPDSFAFIPERWLGDARAPDGRALSRYNVSFGKGMRSCVGMQLAYLEIYVGIATFFRSPLALEARLYETDTSSLELVRDCFVPRPSKGSKGVRVIFKGEA